MTKISYQVLYDYNNCDQAGCSGGEEEGGRVWIDGELIYEFIPNAGCYDNNYFPDGHELGLVRQALKHMDIELEEIDEPN